MCHTVDVLNLVAKYRDKHNRLANGRQALEKYNLKKGWRMNKEIATGKRSVYGLLAMLGVVITYVFGASSAYALSPTPDDTWMANGTVFAQTLSEDGNTLYIGGRFTALRENPPGEPGLTMKATNLAAIDVATGEPVRTWKPLVTGDGAIVQSIAAKNGRVFIGGNFSAVNGEPRQNLAEVDPVDGSLKPFAPAITYEGNTLPPTVNTMLMDDSRLYVGGDFNRADGKPRPKLAAFDLATGALDNTWRPRTTRVVKDMEFDSTGDTVIAVGRFGSVTGSDGVTATRKSVARFFTDTGNVHPWAIPDGVIGETLQTGWDVLVTPTRIYAGFGDKGPNYAAAFRLDNGDVGSQIWRFGTVGDVQSLGLSPDGKRLFFGGHFGLVRLNQTVCGGKPLEGLASLNPNTGQVLCDWIPSMRPTDNNGNGPRAEMAFTNDRYLWVGGGFTHISGVDQRNLARFDLNASPVNYAPKVDLDGLQRGGLDATYFDNMDFTGTRISRTDPTVNFNFGSGSPAAGIGPDTFSARWTGQVEAPVSGEYTFTTESDDGVRLILDGKVVVDNWTDHAPTLNSGTITLEAGKRYDLALDYYENGGGAVIRLYWQPPGQPQTIVPADSLLYSGNTGYSATFAGDPVSIVDQNNLAVTDANNSNLKSAAVALTNRPDGNAESLSADGSGTAIVASYDPQTGVLSLNGPASKADFEKVLRTVSYDNTAQVPSVVDRRVTFVANDGVSNSDAASSTVSVQIALAGLNDPPRNISVDKVKPRIYGVSPRLKTADKTPTVRAKVRDRGSELSANNIRLYVDGRRTKKFSYNKRTDQLTHTTKRLSKGRHAVKIVAADRAGNRTVKVWKFRVLR